jgi:hypothetical protein
MLALFSVDCDPIVTRKGAAMLLSIPKKAWDGVPAVPARSRVPVASALRVGMGAEKDWKF